MAKRRIVKKIKTTYTNSLVDDGIVAPERRSRFLYARIKQTNFDYLKVTAKSKNMTVTQYVDALLDKQRGA